jgi:hypothetical protein
MDSKNAVELISELKGLVSGNLALDIQDDIVSDVVLSLLTTGMPENLRELMETFTDKTVQMYVKRADPHVSISELHTSKFGENKVTRLVDEVTLTPFEERYVVEID